MMGCSDTFRASASVEAARFAIYTNAYAAAADRFRNRLAFICLKTMLALLDFFGESVELMSWTDRSGCIHVSGFAVNGVRAVAPDFVPAAPPAQSEKET